MPQYEMSRYEDVNHGHMPFTVCLECGALIWSVYQHDEFHEGSRPAGFVGPSGPGIRLPGLVATGGLALAVAVLATYLLSLVFG